MDDLDSLSILPEDTHLRIDAPRRARREDAPDDPQAIARTLARPTARELQPPHPGGIRGATVARLRGASR